MAIACTHDDDELTLITAISTYESDAETQATREVSEFVNHLKSQNVQAALDLYDASTETVRELMNCELETIPWRIACEYMVRDNFVIWHNSWIWLGYLNKTCLEQSPELSLKRGAWYERRGNVDVKNLILPREIKKTVVHGTGHAVALDILRSSLNIARRSIFLHRYAPSVLIPTFRSAWCLDDTGVCSLAEVKIVSFDKSEFPEFDLHRDVSDHTITAPKFWHPESTSITVYDAVTQGIFIYHDGLLPSGYWFDIDGDESYHESTNELTN